MVAQVQAILHNMVNNVQGHLCCNIFTKLVKALVNNWSSVGTAQVVTAYLSN